MTPAAAAVQRVLDAIDGIEIDADPNETAATILHAGVVLCGIALMRIPDLHEREAHSRGSVCGHRDDRRPSTSTAILQARPPPS